MRKQVATGVFFCLAGVLTACLFGYEYFKTYGFLNEFHMQSFARAKMDRTAVLCNIIWERGKFFVLMALAAATPIKKIMPLLLQCLICFTAGIYLAACIQSMGVGGALFFFLSWIPHGLFYLLSLFLIFGVNVRGFYARRNPVLWRMLFYTGTASAVLIGCVLESTAGLWILKWIAGVLTR